jgi:exopolyphosphatase/pppGpp-phosphohydrolase
LLTFLLLSVPARAAVHGGIEIGAKGVKTIALDVTGDADNFDIKVLMTGTENTTLTAGLAEAGRFSPEALQATAEAVAKFANTLQQEHKVPTERIYVVGSSGLFSAIADKKDAIKSNQDALSEAVQKASGLKMTFIDVTRESELSIDGIVPKKYSAVSILLDIGGGNTKGGFRDGDKGPVTFGIPYGSVSFSDAARKRPGEASYAEKASALRQEVVAPALRKAIEEKPALSKRERVYLSGGAIWAMTTFVHPGGQEPHVSVTPEDIATYREMLAKANGDYPSPALSSLGDKERAAAEKEIERVKKTFTVEQLLAGAEILKALADEFHFKDRKVYFARNGYIGWILAYVIEKGAPAPR